jgi:hypothetical protein
MELLETWRYELVDAVFFDTDDESLWNRPNGLGLWLVLLTEKVLLGEVNILNSDRRFEGTMAAKGDAGKIFSESSRIFWSLCVARYQDEVAVWDRAKYDGEDMRTGGTFCVVTNGDFLTMRGGFSKEWANHLELHLW